MVATNVEKDGKNKKIALLAHSWGDSVARAFFLWADHKVRRRGEKRRRGEGFSVGKSEREAREKKKDFNKL